MEEANFRDLSTKDKIDELYALLRNEKKQKIKLSRKAKVSGRKQKQGYIGILYIDENGNIHGEKQKLNGSAFKENKALRYHATDRGEKLFWEGKYPIIIQPTWRINPLNIRKDIDKNETYGQPYIMAKMMKDAIVLKKKGGLSILAIVGLIVGGYIAYKLIVGG